MGKFRSRQGKQILRDDARIREINMSDPQEQNGRIAPEVLKSAMKAFKKRLKLTALDDDSRLGKGVFSSGHTGIYAIQPPSQFPREVWEELCRQGRLRSSGHGMYELVKGEQDRA
jgi:hypothetical protein